MSRAEHLRWAKDRALEYLECSDPENGFASFVSDLLKHEELKDHDGLHPLMIAAQTGFPMTLEIDGVRRWIDGFN